MPHIRINSRRTRPVQKPVQKPLQKPQKPQKPVHTQGIKPPLCPPPVLIGQHKIGLAISTYFGENTGSKRLNIFFTSIYSLITSGFDGKIVIVDDCSTTDYHLNHLPKISDAIQVIRRPVNNGLSRCKNTCIKSLLDCDFMFLADDDLIYNGEWWRLYVEASTKSGISHFSHYTPQIDHQPARVVEVNGAAIKQHFQLNGTLLFMTKELIADLGGFAIMPYKFGHEHSNFTLRCLLSRKIPFFCDVAKSEEYVQLNKASYDNKSMIPDSAKASDNGHFNDHDYIRSHLHEPLED